jgi:hypothetical protein
MGTNNFSSLKMEALVPTKYCHLYMQPTWWYMPDDYNIMLTHAVKKLISLYFTSHAIDVLLWSYKFSLFHDLLYECYLSESDELQGSSSTASSRASTQRQRVANVPSGRSLIPTTEIKKIKGWSLNKGNI